MKLAGNFEVLDLNFSGQSARQRGRGGARDGYNGGNGGFCHGGSPVTLDSGQ